jgi:hypothetical protein
VKKEEIAQRLFNNEEDQTSVELHSKHLRVGESQLKKLQIRELRNIA